MLREAKTVSEKFAADTGLVFPRTVSLHMIEAKNLMAETVIKPLHWNMILDGIHERSCVPFLGAAVNVANAQRSYDGLPLGGEVALRLVESLIGKKVESFEEL